MSHSPSHSDDATPNTNDATRHESHGPEPARRSFIRKAGSIAVLTTLSASLPACDLILPDGGGGEGGGGDGDGGEDGGGDGGSGVMAQRADTFHSSIGVGIHWYYRETPYWDNYEEVKQALLDLDIRFYRDRLVNGVADKFAELSDLGLNAVFTETPKTSDGGLDDSAIDEMVNRIVSNDLQDAIYAVTGPNEYIFRNDFEGKFAELRDYQEKLYERFKGDSELESIQVIAPGTATGYNVGRLGDYSGIVDAGDCHTYHNANGGVFPESSENENLARYLENADETFGANTPLWVTEVGYTTSPVDANTAVTEEVQAHYLPRVLAEQFRRGIAKSFIYELCDLNGSSRRNAGFGLLRASGTDGNYSLARKPAYSAIQSLIAKIKDEGSDADSFSPDRLDYSITEREGDSVSNVLLQKSDGDFYMLLWLPAESPGGGPTGITLNLPTQASTVTAFKYNDEFNFIEASQRTDTMSVDLVVPDEIMIVQLEF